MRIQILIKIFFIIVILNLSGCDGIFDAINAMKSPNGAAVTPFNGDYISKGGINSEIVIRFDKSVDITSLQLGGDMASYAVYQWSSTHKGDDTLTLSPDPEGTWPCPGVFVIEVTCEDLNGNRVHLPLTYSVKDRILCVSTDGSDVNEGTRENPLLTLQKAIDIIRGESAAGLKSAVVISEGIYSASGVHADISSTSGFTGDIIISGGYSTDWSEKDPAEYETVLTRSDSSSGDVILINALNNGFTEATVIEHLTLHGGNYTGTSTNQTRVIDMSGSMALVNCIIYSGTTSLSSSDVSTGVQIYNSTGQVILRENTIRMNRGKAVNGIIVYNSSALIQNNNIYYPENCNEVDTINGINLLSAGNTELRNNIIRVEEGAVFNGTTSITNFYAVKGSLSAASSAYVIEGNTITFPEGQKAANSYGCYLEAQAGSAGSSFTISNNNITGSGNSAAITGSNATAALSISDVASGTANAWNITGNTLTGTGREAEINGGSWGIRVYPNTISDFDITSNTIYGTGVAAHIGITFNSNPHGIQISNGSGKITISGNTIYGSGEGIENYKNTVLREGCYGIAYAQSSDGAAELLIEDNYMAGSNRWSENGTTTGGHPIGLQLSNLRAGSTAIIEGNTMVAQLSNSSCDSVVLGCNITAAAAASVTISSNTIKGQHDSTATANSFSGLEIRNLSSTMADITVSGNTITGGYNGGGTGQILSGVYIYSQTSATGTAVFRNNTITGLMPGGASSASRICGFYKSNFSGLELTGNSITGTCLNVADTRIYGIYCAHVDAIGYVKAERNIIIASRDNTASSVTAALGAYVTINNYSHAFTFINNVISPGNAQYTAGELYSLYPAAGVAGLVINGGNGTNPSVLYNNTIVSGKSTNKTYCVYRSATENSEFKNNIFVMNNGSNAVCGAFFGGNMARPTFYNNDFYSFNSSVATFLYITNSGDDEEFSELYTASYLGALYPGYTSHSGANVSVNPLFGDESAFNYALTSGSPSAVLNGGINGNSGGLGFNNDITGALRPATGGWSMGAYE